MGHPHRQHRFSHIPVIAWAAMAAALVLAWSAPALAQQVEQAVVAAAADAPEPDIQTVFVPGARDPGILAYRTVYELVSGVTKVSQDHVQMLVRVTSAGTRKPSKGLKIVLKSATVEEPLAISDDGIVTIPRNGQAYAEQATLVSNRAKGALHINIMLKPKLPEPLRYADIVETIKAAQRAREKILPWYYRMFTPTIRAIGLCYPDREHSVAVAGEAARAALDDDEGLTEEKVYCASFSASERLAPDTVIVPQPGWEPLFR